MGDVGTIEELKLAAMSNSNPQGRNAPVNAYPIWCPRFWHGMRTVCWHRLLASNGWKVDLNRASIIFGVSALTPINDLLAGLQHLIFGRRIAKTRIDTPPIFIVGHWRSGTTLLHELLVTSPQFACPNTFQCFAPSHFLLSEALMVRLGGFLLPKQRPMDNMHAGWKLPQEDEFALMNLGVPSPYLRIAFPQSQPKLLQYLDMQGLSDDELEHWKSTFLWFLRVVTYHYGGKQLILKSPTHTGRIGLLHAMFPDAKFIHLVRSPEKLHPSTKRLWRSLEHVQGLHASPSEEETDRYVVECMHRMYDRFEADRAQIPGHQIIDVRYEDLAADPYGTVRHVYEVLDLGDFEAASPYLKERLAGHGDYRPNHHPLDLAQRRFIQEHWSAYAARYGYAASPAPVPVTETTA